jgi:hypothetical protein
MVNKYFFIVCLLLFGFSCKNNPQSASSNESSKIAVPAFNPDSAYQYTANQVVFGPRVPNTQAHENCKTYLIDELSRFGASITEQQAVVHTYSRTALNITNIIGSFQVEKKNRILLCAHWDSRPFADHDLNPANHRSPIDGANDGAGACGILLEIARQIGLQQPDFGVDIVFFDAEDWGAPEFESDAQGGWCLGSKYWAQHPHTPGYMAKYGILLDMVSAKNAVFYKERFSSFHAGNIVNKVWEAARVEGYGSYFPNERGGSIQDDHVEINKYLKIPCIDIIHYDPNSNSGFGSYWHTLNDNIDSVDKATLKAVGQTVLYVVYHEK